MSASPESLSRTRENAGAGPSASVPSPSPGTATGAGGLFLADGEALEAADKDVLARAGGGLGAQLLDRLAAVLVGVHVPLVEEDALLEPLAHAALGDPRAHVLRLVLGLLLEDAQLARAHVLGHVLLGDVQRRCGGDVEGDLARELLEVLVAGHEVGLAVDLEQHADLAGGVDVALDDALRRGALAALGRVGLSAHAQELDRPVEVAARLLERALAVHHASARARAERFDVAGGDARGHVRASCGWLSVVRSSGVSTACAPPGACAAAGTISTSGLGPSDSA